MKNINNKVLTGKRRKAVLNACCRIRRNQDNKNRTIKNDLDNNFSFFMLTDKHVYQVVLRQDTLKSTVVMIK